MSGLDTLTHTLTHTQSDYRNPRCACAPRVKYIDTLDCRGVFGSANNDILYLHFVPRVLHFSATHLFFIICHPYIPFILKK